MLEALIIDDVPQAIETLQRDLADYCPAVKVVGTAHGVVSGAKLMREQPADLVFLDIQMQDGSGFDLLEIIGPTAPPIIFTTASDAYAIRAFRISAIDYLLKPIDPDDLVTAVEKAKQQATTPPENLEVLKEAMGAPKAITRLALNTLDKIHIANIADILRCESQVNYTQFFFQDGSRLLVTKTLKEFESLLQNHHFLRVHQSHLINLNAIREFVKTDGGYLVMKDGSEVAVSSRKKAMVLQAIADI